MEIEMKAMLTDDTAVDAILSGTVGKFKRTKEEPEELLFKSDKYYSWGGEQLSKPKKIFRVRTESKVCDFAEPVSLYGTDSSKKFAFTAFLAEPAEDIKADDTKVFLTYKEHHVAEDGSQCNIEKEGEISPEGFTVFDTMLKAAGFDIYFEKNKKAYSAYFGDLHVEIVKVNNLPLYLEIETIVPDTASEAEKTMANEAIKLFFKELGITSFEPRNWKQLIEA